MVEGGTDITFLLQFPHEREIRSGPLTSLEVQSMRVNVSVLEVALSINLRSLTTEQVCTPARDCPLSYLRLHSLHGQSCESLSASD